MGVLLLGMASILGHADGVVLRKSAVAQEIRMPDQRAVLAWENGVERLVIETRFAGQGDRFAWIVPLPSVPQIDPVTPGFFPTLSQVSAPRVIHDPVGWWGWCLLVGSLLWLTFTVRPTGSLLPADKLAILVLGGSALGIGNEMGMLGAIWLWGFSAWFTHRIRSGKEQTLTLLLAVLLSVMFAGMLLPALSSAKGGATAIGGVEVLEHKSVGSFETTILRGTDSRAVREWLGTRGFLLPTQAEPVLADHFQAGGVLVASQIRRDLPSDAVQAIHPLRFTFPTPKPVYPMRLTGTATRQLDLDLYVFGPGTARVPGMETLSSSGLLRFDPEDEVQPYRRTGGSLPMGHPELANVAGGTTWFTHLRGRLVGASLLRDLEPQWTGPTEKSWVVWSRQGAAIVAANWAALVAAAAFSVLVGVMRSRPSLPFRLGPVAAGIVGASLLLLGGLTFLRPTVPVIQRKNRWIERIERRERAFRIGIALEILKESATEITVESVRAAIDAEVRNWAKHGSKPSPEAELDAPGHHWIEAHSNRIDVLVFNEVGGYERHSISRRP